MDGGDTMRRRALPASLFAAAAGVDPWRSRHDAWLVYAVERGAAPAPPDDGAAQPRASQAVLIGLAREDEALEAYAHLTGAYVGPALLRVHREFPWIVARADGVVVAEAGRRRVVEAKVRRCLDAAVPDHVLPQLMGEMACYGAASADYVCMEAASGRVGVWRVAWSQAYWDWLLARLGNFWDCVARGTPPGALPAGDAPRVDWAAVAAWPTSK